ncbi:hypothetical protein [Metapseudomonas otitidis]|uniref:hypothetical protein n=1 Tax=Metapseudomonas otitidis TaxID=319939 RepID=UPI0013F5F0F2|nr:hypothetical protein [Pseudomonas otitidis]
MSDVKKRCAACRKEKPVSEMKVCMHAEMHYYVCDSKCMHDFYNPPKAEKPSYDALLAERDQLRAENKLLSGPEETVTSAKGDKLFTFMSKDPCRYQLAEVTYAAPVRKLIEERDQLRAELEAIRGHQGVLYVSAESLADDGVVGMHATRKPNAVQNVALYALPPQQPDVWPKLDKPAKVGAVLFNPGLSARLVVEAAQRQHEYSQQPEAEAARLERFQRAMREFHGEQPDAVSVPRELLKRVVAVLGSQGFLAWDELAAEVLLTTKTDVVV